MTTSRHAYNCGKGRRSCHAYALANEFRGPFIDHFLRPDNATEVKLETGTEDVHMMRTKHLTAALGHASMHGKGYLFLEFGVQHGDGVNFLASLNKTVRWHGFDSFLGMPADRRDEERARRKPKSWAVGGYSLNGELPRVARNVVLHAGWFNDTVPRFMESVKHFGYQGIAEPFVSFAHFDADLYSSTIDVLNAMGSACLLREGSILSFDELFGHPSLKQLEWRALLEASHRWCFRFRFVTWMLHPTSKYGRAAVKVVLPSDCQQRRCVRNLGWCWAPQHLVDLNSERVVRSQGRAQ
jgi:hypothetical protein